MFTSVGVGDNLHVNDLSLSSTSDLINNKPNLYDKKSTSSFPTVLA